MRINQFVRVATCKLFGHVPMVWEYIYWRKFTHINRYTTRCKRCGRAV